MYMLKTFSMCLTGSFVFMLARPATGNALKEVGRYF